MNRWTERNRAKYNQFEPGKIQCPVCEGWYKKICSHVTQRHGMTAREFKLKYGYNTKTGIMAKESRDLARDNVKNNWEKCVVENLIEGGKATRVKKGQKQIHRPRGRKSHANIID